ncbi:MAG: hypothetical protein WCA46_16995, partial [Actinocatenispora sp.]
MTEAQTHENAGARTGPPVDGQGNRTVGRATVPAADPSATSKFVRPPGMNPPPTSPAGMPGGQGGG